MNDAAKNTQPGPVSGVRKFIKQNRQDNLNFRTGWHERLQEIYLFHHRAKTTGTDKVQSWKKYPDKK